MNYNKQEIKKGITVHLIENNRFKTRLISCFLTIPLKSEKITYNSMLTSVLRRGSKTLKTQEEINKKLENMYGASLNCGIDKIGDYLTIKFYIEIINEEYIKDKEDILKEGINLLLEIIFEPYIENGKFIKEYVELEKNRIKQIINSKADNKTRYAYERCIEEMYKGQPYGEYKYGNLEELKDINEENLYEYYKEFIKRAKVDIFASGEENNRVKDLLLNKINELDLKERNIEKVEKSKSQFDEKEIIERLPVSQGKLVIGLNVDINNKRNKYAAIIYNSLLGGGANSKLFQNVREKEMLAYSAGSNYVRSKNNIFIRCGIDVDKYDKTLKVIKEQLEDLKNGKFSDEDIENAKRTIIETINNISEEQDTEVVYYFGQEFEDELETIEEYKKIIEEITREEIIEVAQKIKIELIYFLKN